jgi:hypothetical protein
MEARNWSYLHTSAKSGENVEEAFKMLTSEI